MSDDRAKAWACTKINQKYRAIWSFDTNWKLRIFEIDDHQ